MTKHHQEAMIRCPLPIISIDAGMEALGCNEAAARSMLDWLACTIPDYIHELNQSVESYSENSQQLVDVVRRIRTSASVCGTLQLRVCCYEFQILIDTVDVSRNDEKILARIDAENNRLIEALQKVLDTYKKMNN